MIVGHVTDDGTPQMNLSIAGGDWPAVIDTGFNGDLELPNQLKTALNAEYHGIAYVQLASGQTALEDIYFVEIPFDGVLVKTMASFVEGGDILIGTHLLLEHRLEVNFVSRTLQLERVT